MPRTVPRTGPRGHRYKLTTSCVAARGSITRVPDALDYAAGTHITVTATPAEDWSFLRWREALTDSVNPGVVVMYGHRILVAQFQRAE